MSIDHYQTLIADVCKICQAVPPATVDEGCDISISNVDFTLAYQKSLGWITIFCDFGEIPDDNRNLILQRLLEINTFTIDPSRPIFAVNPETGHVLMRGFAPIESMTADELLTSLGGFAFMALAWRRSHFLNNEDEWAPSQYVYN